MVIDFISLWRTETFFWNSQEFNCAIQEAREQGQHATPALQVLSKGKLSCLLLPGLLMSSCSSGNWTQLIIPSKDSSSSQCTICVRIEISLPTLKLDIISAKSGIWLFNVHADVPGAVYPIPMGS